MPRESVLGPLLFILYAADLVDVILSNCLLPHLYADDAQLHVSSWSADMSTLAARGTSCIQAVGNWMRSNRLQLNPRKSEVLWVASTKR